MFCFNSLNELENDEACTAIDAEAPVNPHVLTYIHIHDDDADDIVRFFGPIKDLPIYNFCYLLADGT